MAEAGAAITDLELRMTIKTLAAKSAASSISHTRTLAIDERSRYLPTDTGAVRAVPLALLFLSRLSEPDTQRGL